ncbi:4469_t:CDS:2, partial [Acaulospora colombiana]
MSLIQLNFTINASGKIVLDRTLVGKKYRLWVPQLPSECIEEIVENLVEDHRTLHSCILVSRLWCRIGVPILWRFPQNFEHKNLWANIVKPILSCMSEESLKFLKVMGCKMIDSIQRPPLFRYIEYMQKLTCHDVCHMAEHILQGRSENSASYHSLLVEKLYSLFLTKGMKLLYFGIPNTFIFYHRAVISKFSNLQALECDFDTAPVYFYELAKYCKTIQQLLIFIDDCVRENFGKVCLYELGEAIKGHSSTLTYFEISGYICLPVDIIRTFENLKTLVISIDALGSQELLAT